jgi:hypothetical protein
MTQKFRASKDRRSEQGIALFIAIFTVLLITAIGAGMIMLTNTDTSISANYRDEQTAFFAAKAGMEEIRDRFRISADNTLSGSLPGAKPGNAGAFVYVTNPNNGENVTPWTTTGLASVYPDTEICTELQKMGNPCALGGGPYAGWYNAASGIAPLRYSDSYRMTPRASWKWTRINQKVNSTSSGTTNASLVDPAFPANALVCWNGASQFATNVASCNLVDPNFKPVYVMTTLAVTPTGSRRMVQAEAVSNDFPTLPGPMIFDGGSPIYNVPSSNAFTVSGNDQAMGANNGAGCPAANGEPALGGYNAAAVNALRTDASNRPQSYTGPAQYGSPSVADVSAQLSMLSTVGGLQNLVSTVTLVAGNGGNVYGNNPATILRPGTNANPQVNVVNGDLTLGGGWSGSGILLVTGNLTMNGNPNYNGLILVIGKGSITKNGGGNGTVNGSLLVANLYNSASPPQLLSPGSTPGIPSITWNGGGNVSWNYDSCWSKILNGLQAYRVVAVREIMN